MTMVLDDLPHLRKLLGDVWIQAEMLSEKPKHLLGRWLNERPEDPWVVRYTEELVKGVLTSENIKYDPEALARKLKSPTDFVSTLTELETALFLAVQGFDVTMEPMAPEKGPDLRVDWEGVPYFVEIRTVGFSEGEDRRNSVTKEIFKKLNTVPSSYEVELTVGEEYKAGSPELREAIKAVVNCLAVLEERKQKQATLYFVGKGKALLDFPGAHISPKYQAIKDKSHFTVRFNHCGEEREGTAAAFFEERKHPPEPVKDHERLKGILEKKRGQLPEGSRGIILLEVSEQFMLSDFSIERALYGDRLVEFPRVSGPVEPVGEMVERRNNRGFLLHTSRVSAVVIQRRTVENGEAKNQWRVYPTNRANADTIRLTLAELRRFGDLEDREHLCAENMPDQNDGRNGTG